MLQHMTLLLHSPILYPVCRPLLSYVHHSCILQKHKLHFSKSGGCSACILSIFPSDGNYFFFGSANFSVIHANCYTPLLAHVLGIWQNKLNRERTGAAGYSITCLRVLRQSEALGVGNITLAAQVIWGLRPSRWNPEWRYQNLSGDNT